MAASGRPRLCAKVGFWHLQPGTKLFEWLCESVWLIGRHGQIPYGRVREWWIVFEAVAPSGGCLSNWNIKVWNFNIIEFFSLSLSNRKCGYYSPTDSPTFISSRNVMLVTLVTNEAGNYPGFRARITQIRPDSKGKDKSWLAEQKYTWLLIVQDPLLLDFFSSLSLVLPF